MTEKSGRRLRPILGELPSDVVVHETGVMEVNAAGASTSITRAPPDLIIERSALLRSLVSRAIAAGVQIRENAEVTDLRFEGDRGRPMGLQT